jgi:hypothetical protein
MEKKQVETLKKSAKSMGLILAGAGAGHFAMKKVPVPEKLSRFKGVLLVVGGVAMQLSKNELIKDAGKGITVIGAIDAVNQFTPDAIKQRMGDAIPQINGLGGYGLGMVMEEEDLASALDEMDFSNEFGNIQLEESNERGYKFAA